MHRLLESGSDEDTVDQPDLHDASWVASHHEMNCPVAPPEGIRSTDSRVRSQINILINVVGLDYLVIDQHLDAERIRVEDKPDVVYIFFACRASHLNFVDNVRGRSAVISDVHYRILLRQPHKSLHSSVQRFLFFLCIIKVINKYLELMNNLF